MWQIAQLCGIFFVSIWLGTAAKADQEYPFVADPTAVQQTFEGWGMSLAWYGNTIFPGKGVTSDWAHWNSYMETLYSPQELGFNIVRYNIGGGENPAFQYLFANNAAFPNMNYMIQGFANSAGVYDWTADQGQILMIKKAKALGANIFEAFSNSPPYFWLKSGSVTGAKRPDPKDPVSSGDYDNLLDEHYDDFANYLATVVKYFHDVEGIDFRTLDPLNEPSPETMYWLYPQDYPTGKVQEGCHFNIAHQIKMLNATYAALKAKGVSTQVSASDDTGIDYTIASYSGYDQLTRNLTVSQINTHSYIDGNRQNLRALAARDGKRLWMSEFGTNDKGINGALEFARNIRNDIKDLGAQAWIIWQPDWGLLDFTGVDQVSYRKQFYAMKQYSHFIRPGYQILSNTDWGTITAYDPKSGTLVFVTLNVGSNSAWINGDITAFGKSESVAHVYVTDANNSMAAMPDLPIVNGHVRYNVGNHSITTVVVSTQSKKGDAL